MKPINQNKENQEEQAFAFNSSNKSDLFKTFGFQKSEQDSGSSESQIALFTYRIKHLTEHLSVKKKDHAAKLGLLKLVGKRKRLLAYLKKVDLNRYRDIITNLGLRK
ncbi:30S ribosomal protein S15 [Cardinium endosymbiont of Philonthus spinipes]|uniref:30S ribosomal protein S15 n=1 Tax=Cardinium endosymbiont of Philonthus spinipes TaxID=3077941 RepID=UPI00313A88C3